MVAGFAAEKGLGKHDVAWIRSYNRWANSPNNQLLHSWGGDVDGQNIMLVELLREGSYIVVVDVNWGHGDSGELVRKLKGKLDTAAGVSQVVLSNKSFLGLN